MKGVILGQYYLIVKCIYNKLKNLKLLLIESQVVDYDYNAETRNFRKNDNAIRPQTRPLGKISKGDYIIT